MKFGILWVALAVVEPCTCRHISKLKSMLVVVIPMFLFYMYHCALPNSLGIVNVPEVTAPEKSGVNKLLISISCLILLWMKEKRDRC